MVAPFVKEKFGWLESDLCWCDMARQTREHLFKECITWRDEIRELWREKGDMSGEAGSGEGRVSGGTISGNYKGKKVFYLGRMQGGSRRVRGPGNTSVRDPMTDRCCIGPVFPFLGRTEVGRVKEGVVFSSGAP